jgi:oxygen-dependent protoporphyrinogen oxidase
VVRIDRSDGGGYELTSQSPHGIERRTAKHLLLTIPAHSFVDVHFGFDFPIAEALSRIEYPPVTSVFFGYRKAELDRPLDGFGMLTPSVDGRRFLGTIWNSSLFKGRTPQSEGAPEGVAEGVAMTTFVGGSRQPEIALWPDDRLIEVVFQELCSLIGLHHFPDEVIIRWRCP